MAKFSFIITALVFFMILSIIAIAFEIPMLDDEFTSESKIQWDAKNFAELSNFDKMAFYVNYLLDIFSMNITGTVWFIPIVLLIWSIGFGWALLELVRGI